MLTIHAIHLRLPGPLAPKSGTSKSAKLSVMHGGALMMAAYSGSQGPRGKYTPTTIKVVLTCPTSNIPTASDLSRVIAVLPTLHVPQQVLRWIHQPQPLSWGMPVQMTIL